MIAVSDSSPLILLAKIGRFSLLRDLFTEVVIPDAVRAEIYAGGATRPGAAELAVADWTKVPDLASALGLGELEAIVLAQEMPAPVTLLMDDAPGRRLARLLGLTVLGSAGLLVKARAQGLIPMLRPPLDDLLAAGLYLDDDLYRRLLDGVGEAPAESGPRQP